MELLLLAANVTNVTYSSAMIFMLLCCLSLQSNCDVCYSVGVSLIGLVAWSGASVKVWLLCCSFVAWSFSLYCCIIGQFQFLMLGFCLVLLCWCYLRLMHEWCTKFFGYLIPLSLIFELTLKRSLEDFKPCTCKSEKENGGVSAEWLKEKVGKNQTWLECVSLFLTSIAIKSIPSWRIENLRRKHVKKKQAHVVK